MGRGSGLDTLRQHSSGVAESAADGLSWAGGDSRRAAQPGVAAVRTPGAAAHRRLGTCAEHVSRSPPGRPRDASAAPRGVYYDRGAAVIGGWMSSTTGGGAWASHDPVRGLALLWGGEMGQQGAVLFAIDVSAGSGRGRVVEEHRAGCREFVVEVDHRTGRLWVLNILGLGQPGHMLQSWSPQTRRLTSHGFPPLTNALRRRRDRRRWRGLVRHTPGRPSLLVPRGQR